MFEDHSKLICGKHSKLICGKHSKLICGKHSKNEPCLVPSQRMRL